jgi:hypothetical protein
LKCTRNDSISIGVQKKKEVYDAVLMHDESLKQKLNGDVPISVLKAGFFFDKRETKL